MTRKVQYCERCLEIKDIEKRISNAQFMRDEQVRKGYVFAANFLDDGIAVIASKRDEIKKQDCSCIVVYQEELY